MKIFLSFFFWAVAAIAYATALLAIGPHPSIRIAGLTAVCALVFAALLTRTGLYMSLFKATTVGSDRAFVLLIWVTRLLLVLTLGLVALYIWTKASDNPGLVVHQNAGFAIFGYLSFLAGKWIWIPPFAKIQTKKFARR